MSRIGYMMPCSSCQTWTRRRASCLEMDQMGSLSACRGVDGAGWVTVKGGARGGGEARGVGSLVTTPSSSASSAAVMPMVLRLERATPRLKALAVGPWKRGCLVKLLVRERAADDGGGGSMGGACGGGA